MARKFDINKYAATLGTSVPAERDIESITAEIIQRKQNAGNEILAIGNCLIEAKAMLSDGDWLIWLSDRVDFSPRTAQRFMRLAKEWTDATALSHLGATKALTLLALPTEEREAFMEENNVMDMTSRKLEKAIRERDEARQAAEAAQADARSAEESRAKMEADMKALEQIHRSAQEGEAQARDALAKAQAELKELREKPVEVAVETVVDQAAVKKAREDAIAGMQAKVDKAEAARKAAEEKRKAAEKALAEAKKQAADNTEILSRAEKAERELAEARRALEAAAEAEKKAAVNADPDLAMFNVIFNQTRDQVNKMHGLRLKIGKNDEALDGKLKTAINALADAVRRCAE